MRISQAPAEVLASLAELQVAAGQVFRDVGMPEVAQNNVDMADLEARQAAGQVWIGEYDGRIAGFVTGCAAPTCPPVRALVAVCVGR